MKRLPQSAAITRWLRRTLGAAWLLATPLAAQVPGGFEQGVYDLRIARNEGVTTPVLVGQAGLVLVPVAPILELAGVKESSAMGDSLRRTPVPGARRESILDLARREIRREGETYPIGAGEIATVDGQLYLAPGRLAEWLGARATVDQENLVVTFTRTPPFPVEQRASTRERRAAYAARSAAIDSVRAAVPWMPRTGGIAAEWNLSMPSTRPATNATMQLQLGGALFGGGLQLGTSISGRRGVDGEELARSWRYGWVNPTSAWFRSVEVGNLGTATSLRSIRGAALSNVHPFRNGFFSSVPIIPDVPSGWSYEIYQNGALLGFSDGTRQTAVPVPLYYGSTPVELRFLGPAGEEVTRSFTYQISAQQIPPGRVEYSLGAGGCPIAPRCRAVSYANVAYGLSSWLTVSGGGEVVDSVGVRRYPYARAIATTTGGYNGMLDLTPQLTGATVGYLGLGRLSASLSVGQVSSGAAIASFVDPARRRRYLDSHVALPSPRWLPMLTGMRSELRLEQPAGGSVDRIRALAGVDVARGNYALTYERDAVQRLGLLSANAMVVVPVSLRGGRTMLPLQGKVGVTREGLAQLEAGAVAGNGQSRSVNARVRWLGSRAGLSLVVTYSAFLGRFRQSASVIASRGLTLATTTLGGTAAYDPRHGLVQSDRFGISTAGVTGRVFFDEDGDGVFSAGDRPAPGVRVIGDAGTARAGDDGTYRLWGVLPYEPARIAIDTLQGIDLAYAPTQAEIRLRATPNLLNEVDIPLVRTRELVGQVDGWPGMSRGGIGLELRAVQGGRRWAVVTFSDGEFYVSRVPPGRYELRVAETSLQAVGAAPFEPRVLVVDETTPEVIDLPPVALVQNQREPSNP
jgi:hypothetical protein